jgi:hypothetical protein
MDRVEKILVFVVVATIVVIVTLALSNSGDDPVEGLAAELRAEGLDTGPAHDLPIGVIEDDTDVAGLIEPSRIDPNRDDSSKTTPPPATTPAREIKPPDSQPKAAPPASPADASKSKGDGKRKQEGTAPKPAPARWNDRYVVRKDDSFWNIAERIYGHGKYWVTIRNANKDVDPENLQPQTVLVLPKLEKSVKAVREPKLEMQGASEFRTVTLKKGEHLYLVLRREGLTSRFHQILALNDLDEESAQLLKAGFKFKIPRN